MSGLVLPHVDDVNRPFWDGCRGGELRLQRCDAGHLRYPIATLCPGCLSTEATWEAARAAAEVFSFAVFDMRTTTAGVTACRSTVAIIQLEEGPRMISNVVGIVPEEVRIGLPVQVVFERRRNVAIPRFEEEAAVKPGLVLPTIGDGAGVETLDAGGGAAAAALGWNSVWVTDHLMVPAGPEADSTAGCSRHDGARVGRGSVDGPTASASA